MDRESAIPRRMPWRPSRLWMAAVATVILCARASPVVADNIDATATTLVQGMKDYRDGQVYSVVPVVEMVTLNARNIQNSKVDDLSLVISGWGSAQFGDTNGIPVSGPGYAAGAGPGSGGDLSLAYIQGSEFNRHLQLRLGRQDVIGGAAQVLAIDGASVTVSGWKNLGITAYGGALVIPRFATAKGDEAAGARAFWRPTFETEVGLSFVDVLDHGLTERQEAGVDARYVPWKWLTLAGYALVSTLEWRLAEASAVVTWQGIRDLQVTADYRRTAPDLFISAASIFSVFAEEREDEFGASAYYRLNRLVSFDGDFHEVDTEEGWGNRAQVRASFHLAPGATVGVQGKELLLQLAPSGAPAPFMPVTQAGENGYWAATCFGVYHFLPNLFSTVDLEAYRFRAPVNGQDDSFTGTLTVAYDLNRLWRFTLSGVESATPLLSQNSEVIARIVYNPTVSFREHAP